MALPFRFFVGTLILEEMEMCTLSINLILKRPFQDSPAREEDSQERCGTEKGSDGDVTCCSTRK
jgi:hypothetical protein